MSIICGHCRLPIANGETGVRHFGHYVAHTENRCVSLLSAEIERLRARVAELEQDRMHAGVDICEVAAAVEVVRAVEIVKEVAGVVANLHEGPFRHGFEAACEEIEHRLRPCEHCDAALSKDAAP